jgi:hypothetical protein
MGKCRTKLDGSCPSFLSQNSLRILIPETRVSQNVLLDINPNTPFFSFSSSFDHIAAVKVVVNGRRIYHSHQHHCAVPPTPLTYPIPRQRSPPPQLQVGLNVPPQETLDWWRWRQRQRWNHRHCQLSDNVPRWLHWWDGLHRASPHPTVFPFSPHPPHPPHHSPPHPPRPSVYHHFQLIDIF